MTTSLLSRVTAPQVAGSGPLTCSTSLALERWPAIVWDPNGYYRDLGVSPRATRRELREAYQRLGGSRSRRLTFVMKQLLDAEVRRRYDATPFGSVFVDQYVVEEVRRASAIQESQRRREAFMEGRDEPLRMLDWDEFVGQDAVTDDRALSHPSGTVEADREPSRQRWHWDYSYYLWETLDEDEPRLAAWQQLLVIALGGRKENIRLAVGLSGVGLTALVDRDPRGRVVVYLDEEAEPDLALAERIAEKMRVHIRGPRRETPGG